MVLLDVVYLSRNRDKSYGNVTPKLMEGIMLEIELLTRYCNLDFIGLLKDARKFVLSCDECQRIGNISKRQEMPMNYSLAVEPFDVWDLITWDLLLPPMSILIFWLLLIMLPSG